MFIISGGRGTGKTLTLMDRAKSENGIFVCNDPVAMRKRAHGYDIAGLEIISYSDLYEGRVSDSTKPIFIHDIDKFIKCTCPTVKGCSVCNEGP